MISALNVKPVVFSDTFVYELRGSAHIVHPKNVSAKHQLSVSTTKHDVTPNKKVILISHPDHACYTPLVQFILVLDLILG